MTQTQAVAHRSRTPYRMDASIRMGLLLKGKIDPLPIEIGLGLKNVVTHAQIQLGRFESIEQAVLFGWTGILRRGKITRDDIVEVGAGKAAFACMRQCNESQIDHLLSARKIITSWNQSNHELMLYEIHPEFDLEVEVEGVETLNQFR